MKLQKVARLCKQTGIMRVFFGKDDFVWYISDGIAAYPVHGVQPMAKDALLTMLDFDQKAREKLHYTESPLIGDIDFSDSVDGEMETEYSRDQELQIAYKYQLVQPLRYNEGRMLLFDPRRLAPLELSPYRALYVRISSTGQPYIAVKDGELLVAVIIPMAEIPEEFVTEVGSLYADARLERMRAEEEAEERQTRIDIDPETGEIMEVEG